MSSFGRIYASTLLYDGSFYVVGTVVALQAVALGASSLQLGLMPLAGAGSYVVSALVFGRWVDRPWIYRMARLGSIGRALFTLLLLLADSVGDLFLVLPLIALCNGMFWPGIQAVLPRLARGEELARLSARFNTAWSIGKMLGFLVGGLLSAAAGFGSPTLIAAGLTLAPALLLPWKEEPQVPTSFSVSNSGPASTRESVRPHGATILPWRRVAWISNFLLFGVGAALHFHFPKLLDGRGLGGREFGIFLFLVYVFQSLAFVLLSAWRRWVFVFRWMGLAQLVCAIGLLSLPILVGGPAVFCLAPFIGLPMGLAYSSSLYYSLLGDGSTESPRTQFHEAVLATGSIVIPFIAGAFAQWRGTDAAPYVAVAVLLLLAIVIQLAVLGGVRSRPAARSL